MKPSETHPNVNRAQAARSPKLNLDWIAVLLTVSIFGFVGCSGGGISLVGKDSEAGLPKHNTVAISKIVSDSRDRYPDQSAPAVPHEKRELTEDDQVLKDHALALRGEGTGISMMGSGFDSKISVELYLDKETYTNGELKVSIDGGEPETWPIIAFDKLGAPDDEFEFIYLLALPDSTHWYLVVIGGEYSADDNDYFGFEGTVVIPSAGLDIGKAESAYKVDFGAKFLITPKYQTDIETADDILGEVESGNKEIVSLKGDIEGEEEDLKELKKEDRDAVPDQKELIAGLEKQLEETIAKTEAEIGKFYDLRVTIADDYAAFAESNPYLWRDVDGQADLYDEWSEVQSLDEDMTAAFTAFLPDANDDGALKEKQAAAQEAIEKNGNKAKNPEKGE